MDRKVTVKYWQVLPLNRLGNNFNDAIKAILDFPKDKLVVEMDEIPYQLVIDGTQKGPVFTGDVIRLQGAGLPSRVKKGGKAQRLELERGEYLGYHTGFVYDSDYDLLGFEIKPSASSVKNAAQAA